MLGTLQSESASAVDFQKSEDNFWGKRGLLHFAQEMTNFHIFLHKLSMEGLKSTIQKDRTEAEEYYPCLNGLVEKRYYAKIRK